MQVRLYSRWRLSGTSLWQHLTLIVLACVGVMHVGRRQRTPGKARLAGKDQQGTWRQEDGAPLVTPSELHDRRPRQRQRQDGACITPQSTAIEWQKMAHRPICRVCCTFAQRLRRRLRPNAPVNAECVSMWGDSPTPAPYSLTVSWSRHGVAPAACIRGSSAATGAGMGATGCCGSTSLVRYLHVYNALAVFMLFTTIISSGMYTPGSARDRGHKPCRQERGSAAHGTRKKGRPCRASYVVHRTALGRPAHRNSKPKCFTRRRASDSQGPASTACSSSCGPFLCQLSDVKRQHSTVAPHSIPSCMTDLLLRVGDEVGDEFQIRHTALLAPPADMHMLRLRRLRGQQREACHCLCDLTSHSGSLHAGPTPAPTLLLRFSAAYFAVSTRPPRALQGCACTAARAAAAVESVSKLAKT